MKYIRTKDGELFEVENQNAWCCMFLKPKHAKMLVSVNENENEMRDLVIKRSIGRKHWKTEILKSADTIEELCDDFVVVDKNKLIEHRCWSHLEWAIANCKRNNIDISTIYGAIWTEWGLKYVAKMNSEGELELL